MKTRKLGSTDLNLSTVGIGTWPMGGPCHGGTRQWGWGPQNDRDSIATILRAVEMGVNWIDTASNYGLGHAEEVVAKAIKGLPNRPIIATKCGTMWDKDGNLIWRLDKASVRSQVEASLKRLGIDVIDLYQIHRSRPFDWTPKEYTPRPHEEYVEEAWQTFADLVKEGKVRYIGVSNLSIEELERIQPIHQVASLQPPYSMIRRDVEDGLLDYCRENNIGVVVYSPLQQGLLTGTLSRQVIQNLPEDDFRRTHNPHFQEPELSANIELAESLYPIAKKSGRTVAQLAIAWVLRRPEITAAIIGARNPSEIEEGALAGDWTLSQEDMSAIDALLVAYKP